MGSNNFSKRRQSSFIINTRQVRLKVRKLYFKLDSYLHKFVLLSTSSVQLNFQR